MRPDKSKQVGQCGPTNSVLQSVACDFSIAETYPYTFTILVANMEGGEDGMGHFTVQVSTKDGAMELKRMN